jgi:hypothetical protein
MPIPLSDAYTLLESDKESKFYSENNHQFLEDTGLIQYIKPLDAILKPPMTTSCVYDILYGSEKAHTPLRYDLIYRTYYYVHNGTADIKLYPPKYSKYLWSTKDYLSLEFSSQINPWDVSEVHLSDYNKTTCINITINKGNAIYIPAYWWYSIQFHNDTEIVAMKYKTFANEIAILPHTIISLLQKHNNTFQTANKTTDLTVM